MTPTTAPPDDASRPDLVVPHSGHRFRPARKKLYPTTLTGILLFIGSAVLIAAYVVPWWSLTASEPPKPSRKGYEPSDEEIQAFNKLERRAFEIAEVTKEQLPDIRKRASSIHAYTTNQTTKMTVCIWGWNTGTALFGLVVAGLITVAVIVSWTVPLLHDWGWIASVVAAVCGGILAILALVWVVEMPSADVAGFLSQGTLLGPYFVMGAGVLFLIVGLVDGISGARHVSRLFGASNS